MLEDDLVDKAASGTHAYITYPDNVYLLKTGNASLIMSLLDCRSC